MGWKKYSSRYRDKLFSLLISKEHEALSFCTNFINRPKFNLTEKKESIYLYADSKDNIIIALMFTKNGQLLPLIKDIDDIPLIDFKAVVNILGSEIYYINSIMGEKNVVDSIFEAVCSILKPTKQTEYNYYVMIIKNKSDFIPYNYKKYDNCGILRRPEISDLHDLVPLQEMYEKEEVLPSVSLYNPKLAQKYIRNSITSRISVICELSGKIVSKANTNSNGINYCQIGGVFTLPEFRNMGIGKKVTGKLVEKIMEQGKKPSLFVKQKNTSAVSVYKKLGFTITAEFKIIYFF